MTLQDKYREVLNLGEEFGVKDGYVNEEANKLKMGGFAQTEFQKNQMWNKIKEIGGESPSDIEADIKVEDTSAYHYHTVVSGDNLSKISKTYYGKSSQYMKIFNANTDQLKNPDVIQPGQKLTIPFA